MGIFDVPAGDLLSTIAKDFKQQKMVKEPAFVDVVKTGAHAERAPQDRDWFFMRCASVLYRVFKD